MAFFIVPVGGPAAAVTQPRKNRRPFLWGRLAQKLKGFAFNNHAVVK